MPTTPNRRPRRTPPITVVLHATGPGTLAGAVSWLTNPASGVSAHYVVGKRGEAVRLADPAAWVCWHAGAARGPEGKPVNATSVGIELVNRNDGKDPYPATQVAALVGLLRELRRTIPTLRWITTHRDVCIPPGRKTDPVGLDVGKIADEAGLALWTRGMA